MQIKSKSGRMFNLPTEEEEVMINAGIIADPDTFELSDVEFAKLKPVGRPKSENPKMPINIRLSPEVLTYFKGTGKGWQTRMDNILKEYVDTHHFNTANNHKN